MDMGLGLADKVEFHRLSGPIAAGSTDLTAITAVDTPMADGFLFVVGFGAITAGSVVSVKLQGSTDDGANYSNLVDQDGVAVSVVIAADQDSQVLMLEVVRPYANLDKLKLVILRSVQNAVVEFVHCYTFNLRSVPATQAAADHISTSRRFVSPKIAS